MPYTMEDFHHDYTLEHLCLLTPEERLRGLPPEERLRGMSMLERLGTPSAEDIAQLKEWLQQR